MNRSQHAGDAHPPLQIARMVEKLGVAKARTNNFTVFVLAVLAGGFVSLGALLFITVMTQPVFGFGVNRVLGGLGFSLGLILIIIAGAELFTGNNLLAMAWASRLISTRDVARNWLIVYTGNALGCLATVLFIVWADTGSLGGGVIGQNAVEIARMKASLPFGVAFSRGVLGNALVCLAVWLAMGGRTVSDKILAIVFPISAFVALGFEHSIANWFILPYGLMLDTNHVIPMNGIVRNIIAVTVGNMMGGTLLVAGVYWVAYLRGGAEEGITANVVDAPREHVPDLVEP